MAPLLPLLALLPAPPAAVGASVEWGVGVPGGAEGGELGPEGDERPGFVLAVLGGLAAAGDGRDAAESLEFFFEPGGGAVAFGDAADPDGLGPRDHADAGLVREHLEQDRVARGPDGQDALAEVVPRDVREGAVVAGLGGQFFREGREGRLDVVVEERGDGDDLGGERARVLASRVASSEPRGASRSSSRLERLLARGRLSSLRSYDVSQEALSGRSRVYESEAGGRPARSTSSEDARAKERTEGRKEEGPLARLVPRRRTLRC